MRPPSPSLSSSPDDPRRAVARFRLVCRRFAAVAAAAQFRRVVVRFDAAALRRLDQLARRPHLARHATALTYLTRAFYVDGDRDDLVRLLSAARASPAVCAEHHRRRDEQRRLLASGDDLDGLRRAVAAFPALQHVKILRVQDELERELLLAAARHDGRPLDGPPLRVLDWTPACRRAMHAVGAALLATGAPRVARFSGPQLSAPAAVALTRVPLAPLAVLAARLTCLELHFDAARCVDGELRALTRVFGTLFRAAARLEALHLGFPSRLPVALALDEVFDGVCWARLRAWGIQAWRLHAHEIIAFARRHRRTLRGLRLRDVLLKDGSRWRDVLAVLRADLPHLEWLSLRRIDYAAAFDEKWAHSADVSDAQSFPDNSDSDDDDDDVDNGSFFDGPHDAAHDDDDDSASIGDESDGLSDHDADDGPRAHQLELRPDTAPSAPVLHHHQLPPFTNQWELLASVSPDDLDDNGVSVEYRQRKIWEAWVVSKANLP
ncbi:hypothetical protein LOZ12_001984 [Ophidiomyces ophidiicola]|nr:hypothetical protein LOZ12_001984 [Ophidiomyces ophidiicola]KAI2316872.1 hypothetical protein LOZ06_000084 [Ophidiomyces ophidiicola]